MDIFRGELLGDCLNFAFPNGESFVFNATVLLSESNPFFGDQWYGEFIRGVLDSNFFFDCPIHQWLKEDEGKEFACFFGWEIIYRSLCLRNIDV